MKAILLLKYSQAIQKNIIVNLEISDTLILNSAVDQYVLVRIIAILFDNAIEGCLQTKPSKIRILFFNLEECLVIVIENTISSDQANYLRKMLAKPQKFSFKNNKIKHGWGLYYIREILKTHSSIELHSQITRGLFRQELHVNMKNNFI